MDWSKTALVFPGQNSQHVGMGRDFAEFSAIAQSVFQQADDILGFQLSKLCFNGPEPELNQTINTQPAVYVCSLAILRTLQHHIPESKPACVAGHSVGEFAALTAADSLDFEDGLRLVRERGRLMHKADEQTSGGMAAVLGMDLETVQNACKQAQDITGQMVVLANDNCPGQIVISGEDRALEQAMTLTETYGARRVVKLDVSIAAHSPLMQAAADEFAKVLTQITFSQPKIPVYANATARGVQDGPSIPALLERQLTQTVRWTETVQNMISDGIETFIEVGSSAALTGLIKRIDRSSQRVTLNSAEALQLLINE